jgi:hypothetical protein
MVILAQIYIDLKHRVICTIWYVAKLVSVEVSYVRPYGPTNDPQYPIHGDVWENIIFLMYTD